MKYRTINVWKGTRRADYPELGYWVVEDLLSADHVDQLSAEIRRIAEQFHKDGRYSDGRDSRWTLNSRLRSELIWEIVTADRFSHPVAELLETSAVVLLEDQFINKSPGGPGVAMHQDMSYFPLEAGARGATCWIALDGVTLEMGPLRVVSGSHRFGFGPPALELLRSEDLDHIEIFDTLGMPEDSVEIVQFVVPKGAAVFFDLFTVHGSGDSTSDRFRPAAALTYVTATSRFETNRLPETTIPDLYESLTDGAPLECPYLPRLGPGVPDHPAWPAPRDGASGR